MVYHKLEEDIREVLNGKEYGRNKIVVETGHNGGLYIYNFDEEACNKQIEDLQSQIEDLEQENRFYMNEIHSLEEKLAKIEEEIEDES